LDDACKTATRLPESIFVQFTPAVSPSSAASQEAPKYSDWRLEMFNDSNIMLDREWCQPSSVYSLHRMVPVTTQRYILRIKFMSQCGWRCCSSAVDVMPSLLGSGGAPHTRCVSGVRWQGATEGTSAGLMQLRSKDVPPSACRNCDADQNSGLTEIYLRVVLPILILMARAGSLRVHRHTHALPHPTERGARHDRRREFQRVQ
jgi:hypothetical protein